MSQDLSTKDRIRQEALHLFAEQGIAAVSVKQIAAAVGMTASNLYAHYKSRDDLIEDLFCAGYADYGRRLAEVAGRPAPFHDRLEAMVRLICRLHDEDADLFRFLLLTQHRNLPGIDARSPLNPVEIVQRTVESAIAAGDIPAARDPAVTAAAVIGCVLQPAVFCTYGRLGRTMTEAADDIVALCGKLVS